MKRLLLLALLFVFVATPATTQVQCVGKDCGTVLATTTIAPATYANLFSAPVTIVPGVPGKIIIIDRFRVHKEAGTVWTSVGSGVLSIRYNQSPNSLEAALFNQALTSQFFDATQRVWAGQGGKGQFSALGNVSGADANNTIGAGLELKLASANITGGTGTLTATVWYHLVDGF